MTLLLLMAPLSGLAAAIGLRALQVGSRSAALRGMAAAGVTGLLVVLTWFLVVVGCINDTGTVSAAFQTRLCGPHDTGALNALLPLLLVPAGLVVLGKVLSRKGLSEGAALAYAALAATPAIPVIYLSSIG